jgi:hypothetical protein
MYFTWIHLVIPLLIMCVVCQCTQQLYVTKLLKQLYHSCRAQNFNPVAIRIFNEGNSFQFTYKKKKNYQNKTLYNHRIILCYSKWYYSLI